MPMVVKSHSTSLPGVLLVETGMARDDRGYFSESYSLPMFAEAGIHARFVQDNISLSAKGTLRGMHYQIEPHSMGKLVRALTGAIFDVAVDLRRGSPTFGKWYGQILEGDGNRALWIPPGFAHGFLALENNTRIIYKCTSIHDPDAERSLHYKDPAVGIEWPIEPTVISPRDAEAPCLRDAEYNFEYKG